MTLVVAPTASVADSTTIGNTATSRAVVDTRTDFAIIDTNNPAGWNGYAAEFEYYAKNIDGTETFNILLVDSDNVVTWVSDDIAPAADGVATYVPAEAVPVANGDNIALYFAAAGAVPFDYAGDPADYTFGGLGGVPDVGDDLDAVYDNSSNRVYSVNATAAETDPPVVLVSTDPVPIGGQIAATVDDSTTGGSDIIDVTATVAGSPATVTDDGALDSPTEHVSVAAPSEPGVYEVCVTGEDWAHNSTTECGAVPVYDPSAGFVTGGGWFDSPAQTALWSQDFSSGTDGWDDSDDGWYGTIANNGDGTAQVEGDGDSAPFSRFDGYRDTWPGTWTAEVDVYLDPSWAAGTGFDYSVAASGSDGAHQRDFVLHVTSDTSTGDLLVAGSNNTNFAPREDLDTIDHYVVGDAGWYTLQHVFYDNGGQLAVDMNLLDDSGAVLFTETRTDPDDTIPGEVGGNRYAWFTFVSVEDGIAIDNHELFLDGPAGRANFGFVAKYKKGANVPDGQTEFQFKNGGIDLHSTSYQWLVVTGSNYARFKGEATVNGVPGYQFMIWAGDGTGSGGEDTFRIRIWDAGGVVYDNGMDTALGGGQIVVHTKGK